MSRTYAAETVPAAAEGERVDRFVAMMVDCSRSEAAAALESGNVTVGGRVVVKGSHRLVEGDVVAVAESPHRERVLPGSDGSIPLDVVHSDADIIVVDKPADIVVHPAPGHADGTLVNALLARFPELAVVGEPERPGIVHRLDRQTSGLMVVARTPDAYDSLVSQLADHSAQRTYAALVLGHPRHSHGVIDAPIGRSHRDPQKMTVAVDGRDARTHYEVEHQFAEPRECALLTCELETGRTHQIRVHLASIGHPVAGDPTYGGSRPDLDITRPFLHARRLSFVHPGTGDEVAYASDLPSDLSAWLADLS